MIIRDSSTFHIAQQYILRNKFTSETYVMLKGGGNQLPVPPVGYPCPVECPVLIAPHNTSMVTNQHIYIL